MGPYDSILADTSKSRLAVDREFMYIGLAGPGRADGRADGQAAGLILNDGTTIFTKNNMFFCRFASGGSASTDFYSSNEKCVQKTTKNNVFFDFSNHARAHVPIFTPKIKNWNSPALPGLPPEMGFFTPLAT